MALEKAYSWQNRLVNDYAVKSSKLAEFYHQGVKDRLQKYIGPHKYIVCLLGSDSYNVNNFEINHMKTI